MWKIKKMIVFIILVLFTVSCSNSTQNSNDDLVNNIDIGIEKEEIRIIMYPEYAQYLENTKSWEQYISDKFNLDIHISVLPIRNSMDKFTLNSLKEDMDSNLLYGLIDVHDSLMIETLISSNLIVPLNEYLDDNATWQSLNEDFRNAFCDYSGNIWAIPSGTQKRYYGRLIRTEWLDDETVTPTRVQELIDIFQKFTLSDPDNNKLNDTYGAVVGPDYVLGLYDIFAANNCIYNINTSSSCAYNPYSMKFEDAAQKESNLIALNQVIYLFQNNFIYENDNSDNACNIYKNYSNAGSAFSILRETETDYYDKIIKNFKMTGSDVVLKTIVSSINRGYSLSINTPDKESMVHSFINTFYGSTDGYCSGAFGIEGINYTLEEGILATASVREHIPISIIYPIPDFEHLLYPIYLLEDGKINMDKLSYNFKEKIIPDNDSIYVNNAFFEQSFDFLFHSDKKPEGEIINYSLYLYDSINADLSAEDIHLEYLALAKKAGTDKLIEEWNSKLNTGN